MSAASPTIRVGERSDIPAALGLVRELAIYEKEPDAVLVSEAEMEAAGFGPGKLFDFFVAELNGTVVGLALYFEHYSTWTGRCIHLEDLYVQEAHRKTGVGGQLFHAVVQEASKRGVRRMQWQVLDWNAPAIAFYNKLNANLDGEWINCQLNQSQINQLAGRASATS